MLGLIGPDHDVAPLPGGSRSTRIDHLEFQRPGNAAVPWIAGFSGVSIARKKNRARREPIARLVVFIFAKAATPPRLEAGDSQPAAFAPPFVDANFGGPFPGPPFLCLACERAGAGGPSSPPKTLWTLLRFQVEQDVGPSAQRRGRARGRYGAGIANSGLIDLHLGEADLGERRADRRGALL